MTTSVHPAKPSVYLLHLDQFPILDQLQVEEALLRADDRNWCILNRGTSPAIVMGISGVQEKLINPQYMRDHPVPVIRRFSGGGTVFVDADTVFVTWICNAAQVDVSCCPQKIHQWAAEFYQHALPMLNMSLRENDYVIGERKWGGNAQYLCKGRWLHHTSILWNYDPRNMEYLLMPAKIPVYRESRSHKDFLCCLNPYFLNYCGLEKNILEALGQKFDVTDVSLKDIAEILKRPHRKVTSLLIT